MTDKTTPARTLDDVTKEFGQLAAQLGQIKYQRDILKFEGQALTEKMRTLNQEAFKLKSEVSEVSEPSAKPELKVAE